MAVAVKVAFDKNYIKLVNEFERQFPDVIDTIVRGVVSDAKVKIMDNTPVKTGQLRRNWLISKQGNGKYNISNNISYVNHLEFGTKAHEAGPFIGTRKDGTKGWIKRMLVKGIRERRMLRDVMPWISEEMPMRMKAAIQTMWTNTFRR